MSVIRDVASNFSRLRLSKKFGKVDFSQKTLESLKKNSTKF